MHIKTKCVDGACVDGACVDGACARLHARTCGRIRLCL